MMIEFDLQRFGGGKGESTSTTSYEPSEYQLHMQDVMSNYLDATMPTAYNLHNLGNDLLESNLPALQGMQSQYGDEHIAAQTRYNQAMSQLEGYPEAARQYMADLDEELSQLPAQYDAIGRATSNRIGGAANNLQSALNSSSSSMNDIYNRLGNATDSTNAALRSYIPSNQDAAQAANAGQQRLIAGNNAATDNYVNQLGQIADSNADVTAQNYLNNINTLQGLAQNRWNDALSTNQQNAAMTAA